LSNQAQSQPQDSNGQRKRTSPESSYNKATPNQGGQQSQSPAQSGPAPGFNDQYNKYKTQPSATFAQQPQPQQPKQQQQPQQQQAGFKQQPQQQQQPQQTFGYMPQQGVNNYDPNTAGSRSPRSAGYKPAASGQTPPNYPAKNFANKGQSPPQAQQQQTNSAMFPQQYPQHMAGHVASYPMSYPYYMPPYYPQSQYAAPPGFNRAQYNYQTAGYEGPYTSFGGPAQYGHVSPNGFDSEYPVEEDYNGGMSSKDYDPSLYPQAGAKAVPTKTEGKQTSSAPAPNKQPKKPASDLNQYPQFGQDVPMQNPGWGVQQQMLSYPQDPMRGYQQPWQQQP